MSQLRTPALIFTRAVCVTALVAAIVLLLATATASIAQESVTRAARALSWGAAADLRALFKDAGTVERFLNEIVNEGDLTAPDMIGEVEEFKIIDLDRDSRLELVALTSSTGRSLSTFLVVLFQLPNGIQPSDRLTTQHDGFVMRELSGFDVGNLDTVLRDLDNDGTHEIVMPELLGGYQGMTRPQATIPEVYVWTKGDYVKVSARYPEFYRDDVLPRLERELQRLEASPALQEARDRGELRALRQKYAREIAEVRKRAARVK